MHDGAAKQRVRQERVMRRGAIWAAIAVALIAVASTERASALEAPGLPAYKPAPPADYAARHNVPPGLHVLSPIDIERYRKVFALQSAGKWREADREIKRVSNNILLGHVQYQRYMHPTKYRSQFVELSSWMKQYRDHPGSERVYKLSLDRRPKNYRRPPGPSVSKIAEEEDDEGEIIEPFYDREKAYRSPVKRSRAKQKKVRAVQRDIRVHLRRGQIDRTAHHFTDGTMDILDAVETDELRAKIAAAYFLRGKDEKAFELASFAANRSRNIVTVADWTAGLAAWRLGLYEEARQHFEFLAASSTASDWNLAAGAYWAARSNLVTGRPDEVNRWLALGARHPLTFYGLISARLLGKPAEFRWDRPPLQSGTLARLFTNPAVQRAVALAEVGQHHLAEREIRRLRSGLNRTSAEALLGLASRLGLPAAEMRLARSTLNPASPYYAAAAYPVPQWTPTKGYSIDRALVFALIRQESHFNARAKSRAGARGLMQIMPATASFVARDRRLRSSGRNRLYDPNLNLELGQRYIQILFDDNNVAGNLFMAAAAYNGGPGNLQKWLRRMNHQGDPLLFIESIPSRETRLYVSRVMANLWIYRQQLGQQAPSLDAVAAGEWPLYLPLDGRNDDIAHIRPTGPDLAEKISYARD